MQTLTALEAAEIATSIHVLFINRMLLIVEKIAVTVFYFELRIFALLLSTALISV